MFPALVFENKAPKTNLSLRRMSLKPKILIGVVSCWTVIWLIIATISHHSGSSSGAANCHAGRSSTDRCAFWIFLHNCFETSLPLLGVFGTALEIVVEGAHSAAAHLHVENEIELAA
jgi:hypothetical protein